MINWISSLDEKTVKAIDFANLEKIIKLASVSKNEMVKYVCQLFNEYKGTVSKKPRLLKEILMKNYAVDFITDGIIEKSDIILSSSDENSYYTIKTLNKKKKNLTVVCFDMHSDTYDYEKSLWKGNSFSKLLHENYINQYIVLGVPKNKRAMVLSDSNPELLDRIYLIDNETELFEIIHKLKSKSIFFSIDVDCLNTRKKKYTAIEYSPATILNNISHIKNVDIKDLDNRIIECIRVKNDLGYSNYYHTGENEFCVDCVIKIIEQTMTFCELQNISVGIGGKKPYMQIMELNGYDYENLTADMVSKLINFAIKGGE